MIELARLTEKRSGNTLRVSKMLITLELSDAIKNKTNVDSSIIIQNESTDVKTYTSTIELYREDRSYQINTSTKDLTVYSEFPDILLDVACDAMLREKDIAPFKPGETTVAMNFGFIKTSITEQKYIMEPEAIISTSQENSNSKTKMHKMVVTFTPTGVFNCKPGELAGSQSQTEDTVRQAPLNPREMPHH
jgi:hypothetical protein